MSLRILITNNTLDQRAGSEVYVRDIALALQRRGHRVHCFSTILGPVARELSAAGVSVHDDLRDLAEPPDIIHGQHHLDTMSACLLWPRTPALYVCHGWLPWEEMPVRLPSILRYVAVDEACEDRLLGHGVARDRITCIPTFVDLARFRLRPPPVPGQKPRNLLILSNSASQTTVDLVRAAAEPFGCTVDVAGQTAGTPVEAPEELLLRYDIVLAKARAAHEALATGAAVIVGDYVRLAGLLDADTYTAWRPRNLGLRTLSRPMDVDALRAELAKADLAASHALGARVRPELDMEIVVDRYEALYHELLASKQILQNLPSDDWLRDTSAYWRTISARCKAFYHTQTQVAYLESEVAGLKHALEQANSRAATPPPEPPPPPPPPPRRSRWNRFWRRIGQR